MLRVSVQKIDYFQGTTQTRACPAPHTHYSSIHLMCSQGLATKLYETGCLMPILRWLQSHGRSSAISRYQIRVFFIRGGELQLSDIRSIIQGVYTKSTELRHWRWGASGERRRPLSVSERPEPLPVWCWTGFCRSTVCHYCIALKTAHASGPSKDFSRF